MPMNYEICQHPLPAPMSRADMIDEAVRRTLPGSHLVWSSRNGYRDPPLFCPENIREGGFMPSTGWVTAIRAEFARIQQEQGR